MVTHVCKLRLEGVVSNDSAYANGRGKRRAPARLDSSQPGENRSRSTTGATCAIFGAVLKGGYVTAMSPLQEFPSDKSRYRATESVLVLPLLFLIYAWCLPEHEMTKR